MIRKALAAWCALWLALTSSHGLAEYSGPSSSVPFVATGGRSAASPADRATDGGIRLDFRLEYKAACDGEEDDSTPFANMLADYAATTRPVTIRFPGACLVSFSPHTISGALSFEGINGGGLKLASGSSITGNFLFWSGAYPISFVDFTMDFNSATVPSSVSTTYSGFLLTNATVVSSWNSKYINGPSINTGAALTAGSFSIGTKYTIASVGNTDFTAIGATNNIAGAPFTANGIGSGTGTAVPNTGAGFIELFTANASSTSGDFSENTFSFGSGSWNSNEGLQFKGSNIITAHNHFTNTGMASYGGGTNLLIDANTVDGWAYGGAITIEPSGITDTANKNSVVSNNTIRGSAAAFDINNTKLDGIEIGYAGFTVVGNSVYSTCGSGITIYGKDTVTGNTIIDAGTCNVSAYYNSAIATAVLNGNSANGSVFNGNTAYDDGGGNTSYGYSDTPSISGVSIGLNDFHGASGSHNITGGATFTAAQSDNRIVNPCGSINQRNATAIALTGFGPDQWKVLETAGNVQITSSSTQFGQCAGYIQSYVSTQVTPSPTNIYALYQDVGLADLPDLGWATTTPRSLIYAFCKQLNISPPWTGSWFVQNVSSTYTYSGLYAVTAASGSRQCFSFLVPPDTHSLGVTPTNIALRVGFNNGSGSSQLTAPGSWTSGTFYGATGGSALVAQPVGTTELTSNIRLLPAAADEGWQPPTYAAMLQNAQRFAWTTVVSGTKPADALGANTGEIQFPASIIAAGTDVFKVQNPVPMFLPTGSVTFFSPVTAASATCRDETANADGGAASASNQSALGFLLSCAGNAATTIGNTLGVHALVDRGL